MTRSPNRKRPALVAACIALVALLVAPATASAQSADLEVVQVDTTRFPDVRVTVAVPGTDPESVDSSRLTVVENGVALDAEVQPVAAVGFQIALLVDTSGSMQGQPLLEAKAAASLFVRELPADAEVALIAFGEEPELVTPFTADRQLVFDGIDGLDVLSGTGLFDAVDLAVSALGPAKGARQLVVAMSDGADTGSGLTLAAASNALVERGVQFTGIGLETNEGDTAQLAALADAAGGQAVAISDPAQLASAYDRIVSNLTSLVDVSFTANEDLESPTVEVRLDGASGSVASIAYPGTIEGASIEISAPVLRSAGSAGLLGQPWVPWLAALLLAGGLIASVLLLQAENPRKAFEKVLRASDDDLDPATDSDPQRPANPTELLSGIADSITEATSKVLEKDDRADRLDKKIEEAGLSLKAAEMGAFVASATLAGVALGYLFGGTMLAIGGLVAPTLLMSPVLSFLAGRRRKQFGDQLGDTLMLISGALKAGYGLAQAIDSVAQEAPAPTGEEFQRVLLETRLGLSMEESLDAVSERMQSEDFEWVVNAVKINAMVGGDLSGILDQVGDTIRARDRIRRQIAALAAEGKISALVLFCLPPGLVFFIASSNPTYIAPLFETGTGKGILGVALTLMLLGGAWLKKIVNPEI